MKRLRRIYFRFFRRYRTLETMFVPYGTADRMIRDSVGKPETQKWDVDFKREDHNQLVGWVHIERRERISE